MAVDINLLQGLPLFSSLTAGQLEKVAIICDEKAISAGQELFREGDPGETIFVVSRGELEVRFTAGGNELVSRERICIGDVLGIRAVFPPYKYLSTASSLTEGTLVAIDAFRLRELFQQDSQLASLVQAGLMREMMNRIVSSQ